LKLLFITTSNLATNPRLVKELSLATSLKFDIEVIQFNIDNWSHSYTLQIKSKFPNVNFIEIEAGRKPLFPWLLSSFLERLFSHIPHSFLPSSWLSISLNKRSFLIQRHFRFVKNKPDLIIAHNPGSFYPAMLFAKRFKSEFAIDVEDYHPGETIDGNIFERMKYLMQAVLPKAKYVSFASKLILVQVKSDMLESNSILNNPTLIDNVFSKEEFVNITNCNLDQSKLNFVWFSQNIDYSRGLEPFFTLLDDFCNDISLTLIGNVRMEFFEKEINHRKYLRLEPPKAQIELNSILSNFDIGLALEPGRDLNNSIAVSNKIWSYLQSGIYILASSTEAQKELIQEFSSSGEVLLDDKEQSKLQIKELIQKKELIRMGLSKRRLLNDFVNWENESNKLISIWKK
jgi:hypothetical protein